MIEQMFPRQKYLEMFKENHREGWNVGQVEEAPQQPQQQPQKETELQTDDTTFQGTTEIESQKPVKPEEALEPEVHTESGEFQAPVEAIVEEPEPVKPEEATTQQEPVKKPAKEKIAKGKQKQKPVKPVKEPEINQNSEEHHEFRVSYRVKTGIRKNNNFLEDLLISNAYDEEYMMDSVNCTRLDRVHKVTESVFTKLNKIAVEHGAKDLNEVIIRLMEGKKKSKENATDLINHQNTDNAPSNVI